MLPFVITGQSAATLSATVAILVAAIQTVSINGTYFPLPCRLAQYDNVI